MARAVTTVRAYAIGASSDATGDDQRPDDQFPCAHRQADKDRAGPGQPPEGLLPLGEFRRSQGWDRAWHEALIVSGREGARRTLPGHHAAVPLRLGGKCERECAVLVTDARILRTGRAA